VYFVVCGGCVVVLLPVLLFGFDDVVGVVFVVCIYGS